MSTPSIVLITLDYPPNRGGVARYLGGLVQASHGQIDVITKKSPQRWWELLPVCRAQKGKALFVSHVFPVGTAAWTSRLLGGPEYAVLFHGLDLRRVRGLVKTWLLRRICRGAKARIVNSHATGDDLRKLVPEVSYAVLTPGVDASPVVEPIENGRRFVLSVARLIPRKGIDVALRAMAAVQRELDVDYVVIGDGDDLTRLEALAVEFRTRVRWIRSASDEEKWRWIRAADLFLLPVRDEGSDVEGFGIVFLEAAAAGVPSIAGRSGGAGEAVVDGETGFLVDPKSFREVADRIQELMRNAERRSTMGEKAKRRALQEFRWEERWDKLKRLLV